MIVLLTLVLQIVIGTGLALALETRRGRICADEKDRSQAARQLNSGDRA